MKQAGGAGRRRMAAFAFPGVQPDVMVIAAGRNEGSLVTHALHHLETKYAAIESHGAIEIGHFQMNMPDPRSRNDRFRSFWHALFLSINYARRQPALTPQARISRRRADRTRRH